MVSLLEEVLSKPFELTKRQKIRLRSRIQSAAILAVVVGVIAAVCVGSIRAGHAKKEQQAALEAQVAAAQAAAEEAARAAAEAAAAEAARPPEMDLDAWYMTLVNIDHLLEEDFEPELTEIENDQFFDSRAAAHLQALIQAARDAGYTVYFCSGFRDYYTQSGIYWTHVDDFVAAGMTEEEAHATTRLQVNYPGASEHQLGLAADILEYKDQPMEAYIGGSGLMLWLEENCVDYGFVIRYPEDKTQITGISYEPWHLRYVGAEAARYMTENGLCLEEFLALYE